MNEWRWMIAKRVKASNCNARSRDSILSGLGSLTWNLEMWMKSVQVFCEVTFRRPGEHLQCYSAPYARLQQMNCCTKRTEIHLAKERKTNYWYLERLLSRDWTRSEWTRFLVMIDLQRPDCRPDWRSDQLVAPQRLVSWKTFPENARSNLSERDEYWPGVFVVSIDQVRNTKISGTEYLFSRNDKCSKNDKWNFNERFSVWVYQIQSK